MAKKPIPFKRPVGRPKGKKDAVKRKIPIRKVQPLKLDNNSFYKVELPVGLMTRLTLLAVKRGTTLQDMIRLALLSLDKSTKLLKLDSVLDFGKYKGERLETVIRADPNYAEWMQRTVERVTFDETAHNLLWEIMD